MVAYLHDQAACCLIREQGCVLYNRVECSPLWVAHWPALLTSGSRAPEACSAHRLLGPCKSSLLTDPGLHDGYHFNESVHLQGAS